MKWWFRWAFVGILVGAPWAMGQDMDKKIQSTIETVRIELTPLDFKTAPTPSKACQAFFSYYGLSVPNAIHQFGTFSSGTKTLAMHVFTPAESQATVLIVHGYYDHSGVWQHVIKDLVGKGFTVAIYDQPGHGLSGGLRASINDFSEYGAVFKDFLQLCQTHLPAPYHVAAHSTGCSTVVDYLLTTQEPPLKQVVLIAPLVRSVAWSLSGLGVDIMGDMVDSIPRKFRTNSSDEDFVRFMKQDPLQARRVPMSWVKAHRAWVVRIEKASVSQKPIRILQGTDDTTVSWQYNLRFLKEKFPKAEVVLIEEGGHQLINESDGLRRKTLNFIAEFFGTK